MFGALLGPELGELIARRDFVGLRAAMSEFEPTDLAEIFAELPVSDTAVLLRLLPTARAAEVLEHLPSERQAEIVLALGDEAVGAILGDMAPDERTALLEDLPATLTQKLIGLLSSGQRVVANQLLGYPEGSVGRRMTPQYVAIDETWTVTQVLAHLRQVGGRQEPMALGQLYVVDAAGQLVDWVRLPKLVTAAPETPVRELFEGDRWSDWPLQATDDLGAAAAVFSKHHVTILPVVDSAGKLLGVVTGDDVLSEAEKASTKDIQHLGGLEALDAPYLKISLVRMIQKRAGWLALLFVGEMLTATAMAHFEDEIAKAVVLSLFIPLIISSGGNSGSQATSLIIRSLATGDVALRDWWRVLGRELVTGLALGSVLAAIASARILLWPGREILYGPHFGLVAVTVSASLLGVVLFGSLVGGLLPFALRRAGLDPAVSSAPLVATLVDVTGLVIYFSTAWWILRGTLL